MTQQAQLIYKDKVIQGLYSKFTSKRDLLLARITKNLEFPECSDIDEIDICIQELAETNSICNLLEDMFSKAQEEEQKCCPPEKGCKKPSAEPEDS